MFAVAAKGIGSLRGRVLDAATMSAVAGARVRLCWIDQWPLKHEETTTDGAGEFNFADVESTICAYLVADAPGKALGQLAGAQVFVGMVNDVGAIVLPRGFCLHGRFVDGDGQPIGSVEIQTWLGATTYLDHTAAHSSDLSPYAGGDDGRFASPPLPPGRVILMSGARGFRRWTHDFIAPIGGGNQDLGEVVLERARQVSGIVVDENGAPIANATIATRGATDRPVLTGADGRFVVWQEGSDANHLIASAAGYCGRRIDVKKLATRDDGEIEVRLTQAGRFCGRVVDEQTGQPVAFASIYLCKLILESVKRVNPAL